MGTSRDGVDYNPSCSTEARGSGGFVHPVPGSGVEAAEGTARAFPTCLRRAVVQGCRHSCLLAREW